MDEIRASVETLKTQASTAVVDLQNKFSSISTEDKNKELQQGLKDLHDKAEKSVVDLQQRVSILETTGVSSGGNVGSKGKDNVRSYIPLKEQKPDPFDSDPAIWRNWKEDTLNYLDTQNQGIKEVLKRCRKDSRDSSKGIVSTGKVNQ